MTCMKKLKTLVDNLWAEVDVHKDDALRMFLWNMKGCFPADQKVDEQLFDQAIDVLSHDFDVSNGILQTTTALDYCKVKSPETEQ